MQKLSLREVQLEALKILVEFDRVARKYDLKYSLCAGTLIGAVRHQGFIPWDDDIDVSMPRPDYEKLIRLNRKEALWPSYMELKCLEDGTLESPFMKLFDRRIAVREQHYEQKEIRFLWIDIFPYDGLPEDKKKTARLFRRENLLYRLNVASVVKKGYGSGKAVIFLKDYLIRPFTRLIGRKRIAERQRKLAMKFGYEESPRCGLAVWADNSPEQAVYKEEYETLVELPFEGCSFYAMSAWHKNLTGIFGDYMQLPPEEERISHDIEAYRL